MSKRVPRKSRPKRVSVRRAGSGGRSAGKRKAPAHATFLRRHLATAGGEVTHRSGFEARIRAQLDAAGVDYEYEPHSFNLALEVPGHQCRDCGSKRVGRTSRYTPDFLFKASGLYVEAKGKFTAKDRKRVYNTDERIPFTGIIETTSYIDPQDVGGNYLAYLPKYTLPGSAWFKMSDEEVRETWLRYLEQMFPDFRRESIRHMFVHRERLVEPIHPLNGMPLIPEMSTPVQDLYLVNAGQIYPELTNGESVTRHARKAVEVIGRETHMGS